MFDKQKYFAPIFFCAGLSSLIPLNKKSRCDFLRNCHGKRYYYYLTRLVENMIITLPYTIIFVMYHEHIYTLVLLFFAIISPFFSIRRISIVIPTPFLKSSFEYVLGFRYSFILLFGLYFLCYKAATYQNVVLGGISLLFLFVICIGYYFYAEPDYYVWIYKLSPKNFLNEKMKHAALNTLILTLPPLLLLCFAFPLQIPIVLYFFLHGYCCLLFSIVLKYQAYPIPMNIGEQILLVFTFICPLLPLILLFALRKGIINKLSQYL